jgi:hypothetical protein
MNTGVLADWGELVPVDAVLVLDVSRSMRHADPYRVSRDAMNLFIEMLTEGRDRVGIVAYAGRVESSFELTGTEEREMLRDYINNLDYASWTDHGVGLTEAVRILGYEPDRQGVIIFLTDGNMNVSPSSDRSNEQSQNEVYAAIYAARQMGVPIHTIGLNFDGNLAVEYINHIAYATGGLAFETANAEDIPEIIAAFFYRMIRAPWVEIEYEEEIVEVEEIIEIIEIVEIPPIEIPAEYDPANSNVWLLVGIVAAVIIGAFSAWKIFRPKRVFTGTLTVDVCDGESGKILFSKQHNLIEFGSRANLLRLAGGEVSLAFAKVILVPSPTAPSHLPQLLIKCKNPHVLFMKDFLEQDAARGLIINVGTEISARHETEEVRIRYSL